MDVSWLASGKTGAGSWILVVDFFWYWYWLRAGLGAGYKVLQGSSVLGSLILATYLAEAKRRARIEQKDRGQRKLS
jgi:hypothetical protein